MIDGLRCYDGMYLYRLGDGWLHNRSNLLLIYYNPILDGWLHNCRRFETGGSLS
jgi:hypothetical protein